MPISKFADQLKALPAKPGVYIMKNDAGEVIYVGKATRLKDRVRSYFGSPRSLEAKTRRLVKQIADFEYILCRSEQEALILESTLVKKHQPFFNIRLKDDKHYPYLKVDLQDPWPRVYITRKVENDGSRYFGPYASAGSVRLTLDLVKKLFPWRSCTKTITGVDPRPCLDYYIHRCIAPCTSYCTKEEYDAVIQQVIKFLEGRTQEVVDELSGKMEEASEEYDYERAAMYRDQIKAVQRVMERQQMATTKPVDWDVFGITRADDEACVQVFFVRGTKVIGRDHFELQGTREERDASVLQSFLQQFYESAVYIPAEILLPVEPADRALIEDWLSEKRGKKVSVAAPQRGEKKQLVDLANENARETLEMLRVKWLADKGKTGAALDELRDELDLPKAPRRIECYDISHTQGTNQVASMVVFIDGHPRSSEYRRFKIKHGDGNNDVESMAEVLRRRFKRAVAAREAKDNDEAAAENAKWAELPDLLLIDGGKPQLGAALDVLRDLGLGDVPAAGLAKENEELFVSDASEPAILPRTSQALYLVQRIRDEAHRFAITFHRQVRQKTSIKSALDEIPGIGPTRKQALIKKFGSVRGIREASVDDLSGTPGITRAVAERVKAAL
ncbi:MAG TPA: excinuclease ABC subunit UvrC [Dehalococcoidia bacterium]|nr:excinuclease ABC subunit UvrC [Dehalococcoidia bacterium]